jgi:hypothetical protein
MKALRQLCQTPLYISEKISLKWNWENLPKFANTSKNIDFEHKIIENDDNHFIFFENFEEMLEKYNTKTLIYNLLDVEYIISKNNISLTITPSEAFDF